MSIDAKIEERKKRWSKFLELDGSQRFMHWIYIEDEASPAPLPNPENKKARIEYAWMQYNFQEDDAIPCLHPYTGTEIFAEAFGCKVYRPEDNNPFALPFVSSVNEASRIKIPPIDTPPLGTLFEIADELYKRAGSRALMRLVDIQSPMDVTALIWDKNALYISLLETPEAIQELSGKCKQPQVDFLEEWFRRYGQDFIAHFPDYYMPWGITLSEDEVGAVSTTMFEKFSLPELIELSNQFGGIGIHCCAHARHQWYSFKQIPNLRMLNLVQPPDVLDDAIIYFANHTAQSPGWQTEWDLSLGPTQFPENAHLVLCSLVSNREQAQRRADLFNRLYRS